jgi:hypothetical protein
VRETELDSAGLLQAGQRVVGETHLERPQVVHELSGRARPTIGAVTAGLCIVQASATWDGVLPMSAADVLDHFGDGQAALAQRTVRSGHVLARPDSLGGAVAVVQVGPGVLARQHPAGQRRPRTPIPSSAAIGMRSRSTVRSIKLYSICRATSGDQPRRSAIVCIRATCHAGVSEMPT